MKVDLVEIVRAVVREELRAAGVAERVYTADNLPPGFTSPEAFAAVCRRLGFGEECKAGRSWRVPASEWHRARAMTHTPQTDEERADALLDSNPRFRLVK